MDQKNSKYRHFSRSDRLLCAEQKQNLFSENCEVSKIILTKCKHFFRNLENEVRSQISDLVFNELCGYVLKVLSGLRQLLGH